MRTPFDLAYLACLGALLLTGCKDEGSSPSVPPFAPGFSPPKLVLPADVPIGWRKGPKSSMRSASFVVAGSGSSMADVSLVIQPGQAGGLLRNVNQWRAQLGLPKLDEAAFENTTQWMTTPVGLGAVIHLTGLAPGADPAFDGRTLTVVVELAMQTWIFKMRGNSELVAGQREVFLNWVAGVRLAESEDPPPAPPYGIPPEPAPPVSVMQVPAGREPTWTIPDSWVEGTDAPERHATFAVPGPNGTMGEMSIVLLADNGGEPLANVNRWHQQAGLSPIAAQDLAGRVQSVWSSSTTISIVQVAGPRCSTMAAWTRHEEGTWFFKLTGPAALLDAERANFAGFLQSIKFPSQ